MLITFSGGLSAQIGDKQMKSENSILGAWVNLEYGYRMTLKFNAGGSCLIDGDQYTYKQSGDKLEVTDPQGYETTVYTYSLQSGKLMLSGGDLMKPIGFSREGAAVNDGTGKAGYSSMYSNQARTQPATIKGVIDPSLVGKWYYYSGSSSSYGASSSERVIEIFADGTYTYSYEGSVNATTYDQYGNDDMYGGSVSQNSDRGTWRLEGNLLHVNSQVEGNQTYRLEKRNNQNNEPMIIIDGEPYVTYYKRPPW